MNEYNEEEANTNIVNEPMAAFRAIFGSVFPNISPKKAPKNAPKNIPIGVKKSPTKSPIVEPHEPYFVPPNFLVPQMGA